MRENLASMVKLDDSHYCQIRKYQIKFRKIITPAMNKSTYYYIPECFVLILRMSFPHYLKHFDQ